MFTMVAMIGVAEWTTNDYFKSFLPTVNSPPVPHRDLTGPSPSYRVYNEEYASVQPRHVERPVQPDADAERTKKDKKWSIGKLFRRKKKEDESGSSSQSDEGVSSKSPSKRKTKKKKKPPAINNFDHIVIRDTRRAQSLAKPSIREVNDDEVLSDPSAGFLLNYKTQEKYGTSKESVSLKDGSSNLLERIGLETPAKKTRKGRLKARVEALRNSMRGESSSEEESLKSSNSSSIVRFRSDESLMRSRDSSLNKRSRSARNERYIKRLSRDEENQLNKEAELLQQGYTKAEVEMLTRTPTSQSSGYGTCKREQVNKTKTDQLTVNELNLRPMKSESISSFPSTQSYPSSINFSAKVNSEHINYSIKYPNNNVNRESLYSNSNRERSTSSQYENPDKIICVKFPLGNVPINTKKEERAPPVPPPRDMHRKVATPLSMYYENSSMVADRTAPNQNVTYGVQNNDFERIMRRSQERSTAYVTNGLRRPISNSEDHIAMQNNEYLQNYRYKSEQPRRPASVSAEPNHYGMYINTPPWRKKVESPGLIKPEPVQMRQDYLYYADQSPRSRRPISIKTSQNGLENQYLSDSQTSNLMENVYRRPRNASEFWRKMDDAEKNRRQQNLFTNSKNNGDYASSTQLQKSYLDHSKLGRENPLDKTDNADNKNRQSKTIDTIDGAQVWKATTEYKRSVTVEPPKVTSPNSKTHVRHKSDTYASSTSQMLSDDEKNSERRKSTNLDDALNELEAIYNSLGLGDEDLLDRAERRELMTPKFNDQFNDWNGNDDDLQLRSQPTTPLRRLSRRSTLPDKLQDDMAFRRMNSFSKEKPNYKETQAQISYMLASPVYVPYASDDDKHSERKEPDIVHDDVMYRNIKQTNSRLKTIDPQPPFGIPVGPVSPAPQSDYLHAKPENKGRSRFVPKRSPDLVSDDLAYRSLRKDNRHSSLFNGEDFSGHTNNNQNYVEFPFNKNSSASIKKKRAVRSLSANIFSMIQKEIDDALNISKAPHLQKTHSNSDVMRRLRDTFENNDNEQDHYPRNKVKQRHNTVNIFVNNTHAPSHHFAKDDSFIHTDDKCFAKPPSCDKSKSSSPSNRSPISKRSSKEEFQHVLSMLAQEAMDTSNKLGVALAELDKNRNKNELSDVQSRISDSRLSFLNELTCKSYDDSISDTKQDSKQPQNLNQTATINNTKSDITKADIVDNSNKGKKTEDSLLVISDQLHKVEDQLKFSFEKELKFDDESLRLASYIDEKEKLKAQETTVAVPDVNVVPNITPVLVKNDTINVENMKGEIINETSVVPTKSLNPFLNTDDKVKEIEEIKAFKELKDGISDLIAGISEVNEKLFTKPSKSELNSNEPHISSMSEAGEKLNEVTKNVSQQNVPNRASVNLSIYEDDLELKEKDAADSTEYNSSEELATIFKLSSEAKLSADVDKENSEESNNEPRADLSSPKLVKTMNQQLRRLSIDDGIPSQSNSLPSNVVPWRNKRQCSNSQNDSKGEN